MESLVYVLVKVKELSTCGHELERDPVKGEKKCIQPAATHFKYESGNPLYLVTVAKKYMFSIKFMPLQIPYIIQIKTAVNISIPRINT